MRIFKIFITFSLCGLLIACNSQYQATNNSASLPVSQPAVSQPSKNTATLPSTKQTTAVIPSTKKTTVQPSSIKEAAPLPSTSANLSANSTEETELTLEEQYPSNHRILAAGSHISGAILGS